MKQSANQQAASRWRLPAPPVPATLTGSQVGILAQRLRIIRGHEALEALFLFQKSIPRATANELFGASLLPTLCEAGLFSETSDGIVSNFKGQWFDDCFFFSDYYPDDSPAPEDYVLSIGPSAQYLYSITARREVEEALDIGCGCGVQTLFLTRHAKRVTATDINPRCLEMTRLNAQINGIGNIELLQGSYFEPVAGRKFDLVVTNTPYVITPTSTYTYRDALGKGDNMVMDILQSLPGYLQNGGTAHMLITWLHKTRQPHDEPIKAVAQTLPAEVLLLYQESDNAWEYTGKWVYAYLKKNRLKFLLTRLKWLLWYQWNGMEKFAFGSVTLRKSAHNQSLFTAKTTSQIVGASAGAHLASILDAQAFLQQHKDCSQYWQMAFVPRHLRLKISPQGEVRRVSQFECLRLPASISPLMGQILHHLDGKSTLRQAYQQAMQDGFDPPLSQEQVLGETCQLLENGFLQKM